MPEPPRLPSDPEAFSAAGKALLTVLGGSVLLRWVSRLFKFRTKEDLDELGMVLKARADIAAEQESRVEALRAELDRAYADVAHYRALSSSVEHLRRQLEEEEDSADYWRAKAFELRDLLVATGIGERFRAGPDDPLYLSEDEPRPRKRGGELVLTNSGKFRRTGETRE